jgi:hypothetical protein
VVRFLAPAAPRFLPPTLFALAFLAGGLPPGGVSFPLHRPALPNVRGLREILRENAGNRPDFAFEINVRSHHFSDRDIGGFF